MTSSSPPFLQFLASFTLSKKFLAALILILLAFILPCIWIIYNFHQKLDAVDRQLMIADYSDAVRKVLQGVLLQDLKDGAPQRQYIQEAFNELIHLNNKDEFKLGIDATTLAERRPGVGTPTSIYHQWQQRNATLDTLTKEMLSKDIQNQLAVLLRYVVNNIPPVDKESALFRRMQRLLDPQRPPERTTLLAKELNEDVKAAGLPPLIFTYFPTELTNLTGMTHSFIFWEELAQQSKFLLEKHKEHLLNYQRQFLTALFILASILLSLGLYFLWNIYRPLTRMLEVQNKFLQGDPTARYEVNSNDEISSIGRAFNKLSELISKIIGQLNDTSTLLKVSAKDISATADKQEEALLEQEKIIRQIAVTVFEISETSKELTDTMSEINMAAGAASALAQTGRDHLQQLELLMQGLVGASNHLVAILTDLNSRTRRITSVISVMVHVADETNMLSLNTSLEAAKAKELGKGFAIIADEIRRIADQTASATLAIEEVVKEILAMMDQSLLEVQTISDDILNSVDKASSVQRHFTEIIDKVQYLSSKFNAVTSGMRTQMKSAQSIDASIQLLKMVTQDSSRTVRQFHNAMKELDVSIGKLNQAQQLIDNG